jgi:uncharacterized membrane protein YphA (DoxX/SURF4 family)
MIAWWTALWSQREHPRSLALVRLAVAAVLLVDFAQVLTLDLAGPLYAPAEAGGMGDPTGRADPLWLYRFFGEGMANQPAVAVWICLLSALMLLLGLFPRLFALVLVLLWAQLDAALPPSDRGIDMLMRNTLLVLAMSQSGAALSLPAWWRARQGQPAPLVPSWPRYFLVVQLVMVYAAAGISKFASSWTPVGDFSALFIAMNDPAFNRIPTEWIAQGYVLTQIGTGATWIWEWMAPSLLLAYHYRQTRTRPGWLRAQMNRLDWVWLYLLIGLVFHVGTHFTLRLGIFPFAMMALYPAAFHPDEWARWGLAPAGRPGDSGGAGSQAR